MTALCNPTSTLAGSLQNRMLPEWLPGKVTGGVTFKQHWADGAFVILPPFFISISNDNKMSMSCGNTKKASILLVRKLYTLMQNLGPLPDSVSLNMKLAYYDDGNTHTHTSPP